jgi:phosphoribosylaminoimidazole-succinocarboxamide synthase
MPEMPDDFVREVSERYILLFEKITGLKFVKEPMEHLQQVLTDFLNQNGS